MHLRNATIENYYYNGEDVDHQTFTEAMLTARDLIADVYVNGHLLFTCNVVMMKNNGYLIAAVDEQFALDEVTNVSQLMIKVHQAGSDVTIMSTAYTDGALIDVGDKDADLYFKVLDLFPYNTLKCIVPESKFISMRTEKIAPIHLEDQPSLESVVVEDDDNEDDDDDDNNLEDPNT